MRRTRKRRRKGGGLLDQLKKGANAVGAAVRKAAGFEKKPKTRALTPEEVAELQRSTQRRLKSASNANEEGRRNAAMAGPSPVAGAAAHQRTGYVDPRTGYYIASRLRGRMDPGTTARAVADDLGEDVGLSGREDSYEFINNNSKRGHSNSSWKSGKIVGVDGVLYKENKKTGRMEKQGGKRKKSRKKRRRKRRRSRRGGQWCKCSDLEKYLIKRNKRKMREERSEMSARRYDERKRKKEMEAMKAAMSPDALAISDGTMTYVRPPKSSPRTSPRTSRKLRREDSNSALVAGGRRRKTRRRRKRRRTRRRRRR